MHTEPASSRQHSQRSSAPTPASTGQPSSQQLPEAPSLPYSEVKKSYHRLSSLTTIFLLFPPLITTHHNLISERRWHCHWRASSHVYILYVASQSIISRLLWCIHAIRVIETYTWTAAQDHQSFSFLLTAKSLAISKLQYSFTVSVSSCSQADPGFILTF